MSYNNTFREITYISVRKIKIWLFPQGDPGGVRRLRPTLLQRTRSPREDVDHPERAQRRDGELPGGASDAAGARSGLARLRPRVQTHAGRTGRCRCWVFQQLFHSFTDSVKFNSIMCWFLDFCGFSFKIHIKQQLYTRELDNFLCRHVVSQVSLALHMDWWNRPSPSAVRTWNQPSGSWTSESAGSPSRSLAAGTILWGWGAGCGSSTHWSTSSFILTLLVSWGWSSEHFNKKATTSSL